MSARRPRWIGASLAPVLVPVIYLAFLRHWCLTWGARADEVTRKLPGDELLPGADLVTTRAVTVNAPPEAIWPWLVQMSKAGDELPVGPGRAAMRVVVLDPPRAFAIRVADQNRAWIFALVPEGSSTRLISRNRIATSALSPAIRLIYMLFMEPGSLVMERKMLLGIKQRAERR